MFSLHCNTKFCSFALNKFGLLVEDHKTTIIESFLWNSVVMLFAVYISVEYLNTINTIYLNEII